MSSKKKIKEVPLYEFQPLYLVENFSEVELKREYNRLSKLANKRIEALERSRFKEHTYYQRFKGYVGKDGLSKVNLAKAITELKKFEYSPLLSVRKLYETRRKTIATLRAEGYTFVNVRNYQKFTEFMEYAQEKVKNRLWDSEKIVKFYYENRRVNNETLQKRFREWVSTQE